MPLKQEHSAYLARNDDQHYEFGGFLYLLLKELLDFNAYLSIL